jgi:hypothetical protein
MPKATNVTQSVSQNQVNETVAVLDAALAVAIKQRDEAQKILKKRISKVNEITVQARDLERKVENLTLKIETRRHAELLERLPKSLGFSPANLAVLATAAASSGLGYEDLLAILKQRAEESSVSSANAAPPVPAAGAKPLADDKPAPAAASAPKKP